MAASTPSPDTPPSGRHGMASQLTTDESPRMTGGHKRGRVLCGARTRQGRPCVRRAVAGKCRCPNHGGHSTGPRTAEGKARSARNLPNLRLLQP
ncbi:HGGxSTG domain-containing protein [Thermomonas sp.]|uniref:HGGxSTG domain-containing protein n=1 Tax=Thermomonas sp. TaxID=1971895 RepID=UPI0035B44B2F